MSSKFSPILSSEENQIIDHHASAYKVCQRAQDEQGAICLLIDRLSGEGFKLIRVRDSEEEVLKASLTGYDGTSVLRAIIGGDEEFVFEFGDRARGLTMNAYIVLGNGVQDLLSNSSIPPLSLAALPGRICDICTELETTPVQELVQELGARLTTSKPGAPTAEPKADHLVFLQRFCERLEQVTNSYEDIGSSLSYLQQALIKKTSWEVRPGGDPADFALLELLQEYFIDDEWQLMWNCIEVTDPLIYHCSDMTHQQTIDFTVGAPSSILNDKQEAVKVATVAYSYDKNHKMIKAKIAKLNGKVVSSDSHILALLSSDLVVAINQAEEKLGESLSKPSVAPSPSRKI